MPDSLQPQRLSIGVVSNDVLDSALSVLFNDSEKWDIFLSTLDMAT